MIYRENKANTEPYSKSVKEHIEINKKCEMLLQAKALGKLLEYLGDYKSLQEAGVESQNHKDKIDQKLLELVTNNFEGLDPITLTRRFAFLYSVLYNDPKDRWNFRHDSEVLFENVQKKSQDVVRDPYIENSLPAIAEKCLEKICLLAKVERIVFNEVKSSIISILKTKMTTEAFEKVFVNETEIARILEEVWTIMEDDAKKINQKYFSGVLFDMLENKDGSLDKANIERNFLLLLVQVVQKKSQKDMQKVMDMVGTYLVDEFV